jgi:GNAT superfamily N-acetyltransferase
MSVTPTVEIDAVRTYLEMTEVPPERIPFPDPGCRLDRVDGCPPSFYRFLYAEVGRPWHWLERLPWTDEAIRRHLAQPGLELWVLYCNGTPAGFGELRRQRDQSTEIAYFGLLPEFIGRGLGRAFLSATVAEAWKGGTKRVWLHTCTLDHSNALPNYLKRGFRVFRQEHYLARVPASANSSLAG